MAVQPDFLLRLIQPLKGNRHDHAGKPTPAKTSSPFASWRGEHAGIRVPDYAAAAKWYTKKLDFRIVYLWPFGELTFAYILPAADDTFRPELVGGPGAAEGGVARWRRKWFQAVPL